MSFFSKTILALFLVTSAISHGECLNISDGSLRDNTYSILYRILGTQEYAAVQEFLKRRDVDLNEPVQMARSLYIESHCDYTNDKIGKAGFLGQLEYNLISGIVFAGSSKTLRYLDVGFDLLTVKKLLGSTPGSENLIVNPQRFFNMGALVRQSIGVCTIAVWLVPSARLRKGLENSYVADEITLTQPKGASAPLGYACRIQRVNGVKYATGVFSIYDGLNY